MSAFLLRRRKIIAEQACRVGAPIATKIRCWELYREAALEANDEKEFDYADKQITLLQNFL